MVKHYIAIDHEKKHPRSQQTIFQRIYKNAIKSYTISLSDQNAVIIKDNSIGEK